MKRISINADMGEGYGAYRIGSDAALLDIVSTANVACGFHGGDAATMRSLAEAAKARGVSIGAHPGFDDLWGFGRRRIRMPSARLEEMIAYQIGAMQAMARYAGIAVTHVKAHGALNNMAMRDADYAQAIVGAIAVAAPDAIHLGMPNTEHEIATRKAGVAFAREAFADRTYEADGTLTPRDVEGAVINDPERAAAQAVSLALEGVVVARTGERVSTPCESLCVHGDEPTAVAVARAVRDALTAEGVAIATLPDMLR